VSFEELEAEHDFRLKADIDNIISEALIRRSFKMYLQPIYNVRTRRFESAEALIRLIDDEYGFVSPAIFIPEAESTGQIMAIGDFVLDETMEMMARNDVVSLGVKYVEINLSVEQCLQSDLPEKIRALQEKYQIRPDQVNFEITETVFDSLSTVMDKNLKRLVEMGYSFSLDDYGTGYSNIMRLSKLPLKIIKIDKSLIDDLGSESGKTIIKNVIRMMKDIDKELVAEGVESEKEVDMLSELDCDFIQGFYYSKPLPVKEFVNWIRKIQAENSKSDPLTHMV
jgi:EAL domain-containing protein (putative c-di-GMP-specific phosphodiesterase class I)